MEAPPAAPDGSESVLEQHVGNVGVDADHEDAHQNDEQPPQREQGAPPNRSLAVGHGHCGISHFNTFTFAATLPAINRIADRLQVAMENRFRAAKRRVGAWCLAEAVGFEPTNGRPLLVFKTSALNHSATLPDDARQLLSTAPKRLGGAILPVNLHTAQPGFVPFYINWFVAIVVARRSRSRPGRTPENG
jgi:hypothetical protein